MTNASYKTSARYVVSYQQQFIFIFNLVKVNRPYILWYLWYTYKSLMMFLILLYIYKICSIDMNDVNNMLFVHALNRMI